MGVAALQAQYLSMTGQQSDVEYQLTILGNRRQSLTYKSSALMDEYMTKMQKNTDNQQLDQTAANIQTFDSQAFMMEYEAATNRLNAQDKMLELQSKNLETKQKAISTAAEGVQKQIQKNAEKEFNTSMG